MSLHSGSLESIEEPRLREVPVAFQRGHRDLESLGRLTLGQPGEEAELHHAACACIDGLELRQRFVEGDEILFALAGGGLDVAEGDLDMAARGASCAFRARA